MASKVMSKVNGRSRFLARKAPFLDAVSLRLLSNSLALCCFDYGLGSWYGGLKKAIKEKLQVLRNRLVREVLGSHQGSMWVSSSSNSWAASFDLCFMLDVLFYVDTCLVLTSGPWWK